MNKKHLPLVSIITVCKNSAETINDCILSVNRQSYPNIEHVIIDGNSTDSTKSIISSSAMRNVKLYSSDDNGIYDAMNKGLERANGDVIGFLNSDDLFYGDDIVLSIVNSFNKKHADIIWGNLVYVDKFDISKVKRVWNSRPLTRSDLSLGIVPPHPTFYFRKTVETANYRFNQKYRLAADFDFMISLLTNKKLRSTFVPERIVKMRNGGATNVSYSNIYEQNKEIVKSIHAQLGEINIIKFIKKVI